MKEWELIEGSEVVVRKENFRVQDFKNRATPVDVKVWQLLWEPLPK